MNQLVYPSFDAVMEAHAMIIKRTGAEAGMVGVSNLKYILETVHDIGEELGNELEVVIKKAAYLMYHMVVSHPFLYGNKRSAFEVTKRFLELNNWIFEPYEEESFHELTSLAAGRVGQDYVEEWIGRNLRKGKSTS